MIGSIALPMAVALGLLAAEPPKWTSHSGYRSFPVAPSGSKPGFTSIPANQTGIAFTNLLSQRMVAMNRVTENGSGVALGDVDGDGWCDIYFCGLEQDNRLFRNLGNWRFEDITARAGVACPQQLSTGATFADVDGDGDLDLLVNSIGGGTRLFLNNGAGVFTELLGSRLIRRFSATSLALADVDLDGDLDLYVANYRSIVFKDELPQPKIEARMEGGRIVVSPPGRFDALRVPGGNVEVLERAERDFLYINDGKGFFSPVSWTNGNFFNEAGQKLLSPPLDWALSVMIRDLNGDFLPDIITCNDFFYSPDRIWLQQPGTKFQAISLDALRKVSLASMAVDVADVNRDGHDDLFFVEMLGRDHRFRQTHLDNVNKAYLNNLVPDPLFRPEIPRNTFFLSRGDGTYAEIAELAGLDASEWSWGAIFLDVDLDGFEDLLVPTGHNHDVQDADVLKALGQMRVQDSIPQRIQNLSRFKRLLTPIIAFRNGGALKFIEAQEAWGLDIPGIVNGFACADLDNDGDLDLVANRLNGEALLLRNDSPAPRIAVRLKGSGGNTRAIGAKIFVRGAPVTQSQTMIAGGRYLSSDDAMRVFAGAARLTVEIQWPNRTTSIYSNLPPNHVYEFAQSPAARAIPPAPQDPEPMFVETPLDHRHSGETFDDLARQPLLPYSLASQGPALAWFDLDGDHNDELIVAGGRGQSTRIFRHTADGFQPLTNIYSGRAAPSSQAGVLAARLFDSRPALLAAFSNYESASSLSPSVEIRSATNAFSLPGDFSTAGALALHDIDGDGDLDLFVAGRVSPGRYPAPASSRVFRNENGGFTLDVANTAIFQRIGLVTSALFADLDGDGSSELIAAVEGGEIRAWKISGGQFAPLDLGLGTFRGLWTSLAVGDFNNDGKLDLIAGNWGRNTRYQRFLDRPMRFHFGDFDANGTHDLLESIYDAAHREYYPVASLDLLRKTLPALVETIPSYEQFSRTTAEQLLRGRAAQTLEITTLESMCFLNRGSTFEPRPLPLPVQFAPMFGCAVADFDGDGHEDLALGQNLFDTRWETGRLDSGVPLLLRGDGRGNFTVVYPERTGWRAWGQQRALAAADFNADGRVDLAISQHGDNTKLFQNRSSPPGLRIRFQGGDSNLDAVGTQYQVLEEGRPTPVRQILAGSGWLTQNSFVQVVKRPGPNARLAVTWPTGKRSEFAIPADSREIVVTEQGITHAR